MTNRARPTWPDGADSPKSQRPQSGSGTGQSTPPATPASRSNTNGNGQQPRPGTASGPRPGETRQQPRPGGPSAPGGSTAQPARPPQQPPVRPAAGSTPFAAGSAPTTPRPAPSTPGRPEPRLPASGGQPGGSAYGQTGKLATPTHTPNETFGDKLNAAKQAVLDRASALKDSAKQPKQPQAAPAAPPAPPALAAEPTAKRATPERVVQPVAKPSGRPQTRKARLRVSRLDPWSVMKTAFLLSIAFGIVTWVAVFIVWSAIGAAGVFDNINNTVREVLGTTEAEPFAIENYINTGKVMGFTTLLACADVLIITALATLGSFLYNIAATLLGGLEVTLASED
ncbi:DUF3566 domain-containing protein [Kribbella catacumbae]|uniref:DUF3566 domain-containing protein n=1 Tax=Kribbella catacumbae TaxID=460086 RepID=UPI00039E7195|nr:DUF3566 domain-containing protein [Kribbella catacumbae]